MLKSLPVDLFLGAHGAYFGMKAKYERMKNGDAKGFIDPAGYKAYVDEREAAFRKEGEAEGRGEVGAASCGRGGAVRLRRAGGAAHFVRGGAGAPRR